MVWSVRGVAVSKPSAAALSKVSKPNVDCTIKLQLLQSIETRCAYKNRNFKNTLRLLGSHTPPSRSVFLEFCTRHGTISNFCSISISIFSGILFSKSISISKFFKQFLQYQNQYQYQNFPTLNIKINIKIFQNPESISKFLWLKNLFFHILWLMPLGTHGIPSNTHSPQTWNLGTLFRTKGSHSETHGIPPMDSISQKWLLG